MNNVAWIHIFDLPSQQPLVSWVPWKHGLTLRAYVSVTYMELALGRGKAAYTQEGILQKWQPSPAVTSPGHSRPGQREGTSHQRHTPVMLYISDSRRRVCLLRSTPPSKAARLHRCWRRTVLGPTSFHMWVWHSRWEQSGGTCPPSTCIWVCCSCGLEK